MKFIHKLKFKIQKNSPTIAMVVGGISVITGTVLACIATTKIGKIKEEEEELLEYVANKPTCDDSEEETVNPYTITDEVDIQATDEENLYTIEDKNKEMALIALNRYIQYAKLYILPVALEVFGLGLMFGSHKIMCKRNAAMLTAYSTVETAYRTYRKKVAERFGDEVDKELRFGAKTEIITEKHTDEKGDETTEEKQIDIIDPNAPSMFARFFDSTNENWVEDNTLNLMFLNQVQSYYNDLLRIRGYVFLNEVYSALGFDMTPEGQIAGWAYSNDEEPEGDNYIDFGIFDKYNAANRRFVNGYEPVILLDFNVDGNILGAI